MLSRVANSIYWMCRYMERAENIARFIDVNLNLQADAAAVDEQAQWSPLILTTGDQDLFEEKEHSYTKKEVLDFLTFDRDYLNSIVSCVAFARENARTIREIISSDIWEHLNDFYHEVTAVKTHKTIAKDPHKFYNVIRMGNHLFAGLMDCTMNHGEPWNFARLGTMLERADKTSRILDVKYFMLLRQIELVNSPTDNIQWLSVLRSASAFEMYRKEVHQVTPTDVADFLIFSREFPRSIHHCVGKAKESLRRICGSDLTPAAHNAERQLGKLMARLEYTDIREVIKMGLHEFLDALQIQLNLVDTAVGVAFFNVTPPQQDESDQQ